MPHKLCALLLAFVLMLPLLPVSGQAESSLRWSDRYSYVLREDGTAQITGYESPSSDMVIPSELDGHPVASLSGCFSFIGAVSSVSIPDTLTEIVGNPFASEPVETFIVSPDHPALEVVDGALYSKGDHRLIACPRGTPVETFRIQPGTLVIEDFAFMSCRSLAEVTIPEGVTRIGRRAFSHCGLKRVTLPDSVGEIGDNPFSVCKALTEIRVSPDHPALEVVDGALYSKGDHRLVCLPAGLSAARFQAQEGTEAVGAWAFAYCANLEEVLLPDSVASIGESAFSHCEALALCPLPQGITAIEANTFAACESLEEITLPEGVTRIGGGAFMECLSLSAVTLQATLADIGDYAFSGCAFAELELPAALTSLGRGVFEECVSLTHMELPAGLTELPEELFTFCDQLMSVTIPEGVTAIGEKAFCGCVSLTALRLPESLAFIDVEAFEGCESLEEITLPDSVAEIGEGAFANCEALALVTLSAGTEIIGEEAFEDCPDLTLTAPENSAAERYCLENDISFLPLGEE
ncbi:MAG: leucine-rich repeat domain-containing protein [Clostridia bacterium]|nr:leucine-rich repeat domain-containing protein [Clostridia bacterium]